MFNLNTINVILSSNSVNNTIDRTVIVEENIYL